MQCRGWLVSMAIIWGKRLAAFCPRALDGACACSHLHIYRSRMFGIGFAQTLQSEIWVPLGIPEPVSP